MDLSSSLRRKQSTVTYGKRHRTPGNSTHSSPAVARSTFPSDAVSSSSTSSDDEAGPSDLLSRRKDASKLSPSSQTDRTTNPSPKRTTARLSKEVNVSPLTKPHSASFSNGSPKRPSVSTPSAIASTSRTTLNARSVSSTTPSPFLRSGASSAALHSTSKSLPQRPPRAASPTPSKSDRPPAKRSASSSPRKLSSSISPSKRLARSRTPSRPAQDLSGLFDAIEPTLPQSRNPFARSESSPTVILHRDDAGVSLASAPAFAPSPLQSPTLSAAAFDDTDAMLSPGTLTSPSKRARMADRMAPRAARTTKSRVDEIAEALNNSRRGSLRRTETAPSATSDGGSLGPFAAQPSHHGLLNAKEDESKSASRSDAGSARFETASQADSQSVDGSNSAPGGRRLAGIKQTSANNARRTYGLQRSFLADQAEDNLLTESPAQPTPAPSSRNIEDQIEAELRGNSNGNGYATSKSLSAPLRKPVSATSAPRESYAELLKKWGEGADDIEWDESQDPTLNLKSITSLRSQGELRRFNDDLEYLFTGFDVAQSLSTRRASAVELIRLLCGKPDLGGLAEDASDADDDDEVVEDPLASAQSAEFLRKLKASDLIARLFDLFKGAEAGEGVDDVLDAAMALYIARLLKSGSSAEPLTRERWSELNVILRDLLTRSNRSERQERKDGFAPLRPQEPKLHKGSSKSDRRTLTELRDIARISKLFVAGSKSWTLRNLVLAACCSLIALPRRLLTENAVGDLFVDANGNDDHSRASLFSDVLAVLISEGVKAQHRLNDFAKGLEIVPYIAAESVPDLETADLCVRFLDKGMDILYLELDQAVPASSETIEALQHLIAFAIQAAPFGDDSSDAGSFSGNGTPNRALQILHGLFKMLLDLSQVDANWSESLASSVPIQESIMLAFLLAHAKASRLRQNTAKGKNRSKNLEDDPDDDSNKLGMALFEDVVHLSLALLTNLLIKQHDKARDTLQSLRIHPSCWGRRTCASACTCENRQSALQLLARVFFETRIAAASRDDSSAAYLSNSVATALAQFAVGGQSRSESCRDALDAELPANNSVIRGSGWETLLEAVEEFAVVHEAALCAERARAGEVDAETRLDDEEGDETVTARKEGNGDSSNPVAVEAGQLIKDLAVALRQMA